MIRWVEAEWFDMRSGRDSRILGKSAARTSMNASLLGANAKQ